ncbi:MAG TPA: toll/interleukin-1 receptor domain-containing protein [Urbifossiella sp.]|nr:toll/interleukin-1 receptor domain-containing protein [Urbifossiella sp.]
MSDPQNATCPKCSSSSAWNGTRCQHCNPDNPDPHPPGSASHQAEKTIRVLVVEEASVMAWRSRLKEFSRYDPKGYEAANYLRCRDACDTFPGEVVEFHVSPTTPVADLILRYVGEHPRTYKRDELRAAATAPDVRVRPFWLPRETLAEEEPLDLAVQLAAGAPSLALVCPKPGERHPGLKWTGTVGEAGFDDGDALLLRRTSPADLLSTAASVIVERSTLRCVRTVRDAAQFFNLVRDSDLGAPSSDGRDYARFGHRQKVMLLYTEDDVHVASYVRTHFDMLDKASGELCDVFFIEDPDAVRSSGFWKNFLSPRFYAAWRVLGWAHSHPYNKEEVYTIAGRLGVPFDALPCAAVIAPNGRRAAETVPLGQTLTSDFRQLFARFQTTVASVPRQAPRPLGWASIGPGAGPQAPDPERPVCFLSHSSADKVIVRAVAVALHSLGLDTWFDEREMIAGDSITTKLEDGLKAATAVVIFLSAKSLASPWVNAEIRAAMHQQIVAKKYRAIVPVLLDPCDVPLFLHDYKQIGPEATAEQIADEIKRAVRVACSERV